MSKFKIINLLDKVFVTLCVFIVIYAWINFFIRNLNLTFILSVIFTAACVFLLFYFLNKKQCKQKNKENYFKEINEKFLAFRLLSKENKILLISKILSLNYKVDIKNNNIMYVKANKKCVIVFALNSAKLDEYSLITLLENIPNKTEEINVICNEYTPGINVNILKDVNINLINKKNLYDDFFLKNQIYPDCSRIKQNTGKLKLKDMFAHFFAPHKSKSFFFCGLILIISAIILPYHYYYLIFGTILLIFSIICKLKTFVKRY